MNFLVLIVFLSFARAPISSGLFLMLASSVSKRIDPEEVKEAEGWQDYLNHPESWWSAFQAQSLTDREVMFKELSQATERFQIDSFRSCEALLNIWLAFLEIH